MTDDVTGTEDNTSAPVSGAKVNRREFVSRVLARTDAPRGAALPVIEATLSEFLSALEAGERVSIPGFGRASLANVRETDKGEVLSIRIRKMPEAESEAEVTDALAPDIT